MALRRRRRRGSGRREAASIEELVVHIAEDKSRSRFRPVAPGTERPREVFLDAVQLLVQPLEELGFTYARSGPHATRRRGHVISKVHFGSSYLDVPGELVSLSISIGIHDRTMGAWRKADEHSRRADDLVSTMHLGHLLDPPVALDWNLADRAKRPATIADAAATIHRHAMPFIEDITQLLAAPDLEPERLASLVESEALVEYFVRSGRLDEAGALVSSYLAGFPEGILVRLHAQIARFRSEGLPEATDPDAGDWLAFLVVRHELPTRFP